MPPRSVTWFVQLVAISLMASACTGAILSVDESPRVSSPLPVSGASPFHDCSVGQPIPDSEVEPSLAVDPDDPERLLGAWQQDRNFRGGALGIVTASSTDGGASWDTDTPAI